MVIAYAIKTVGLRRQSDSDVIDQANGSLARAITVVNKGSSNQGIERNSK